MRRKAFTILELLVVIGIIVLIAAILLPMLSRTYREAQRARQAADLHAIETALEAYKNDFGDYPRFDPQLTNAATSGASLLCWALIAPGPAMSTDPKNPADGADGVGFRIRGTQGKVYSYLQMDQFKVGMPVGDTSFNDATDFIADRWGNPILYYPANRTADVRTTTGYVGNVTYGPSNNKPPPYFNGIDNANFQYTNQVNGTSGIQTPSLAEFSTLIGYTPGKTVQQPLPMNYVLWSAGPNGTFGPGPNASAPAEKQPKNPATWDDVTNIAQ